MTDVLRVAALVAAALEACGVRYLIGGSLASSFAGEPRSTLDVDMVAELSEASVIRFGEALGSDFYFDPVQAQSSLRRQSSFNVIHEPTGIKVDLFPSHTELARLQMDRRRGIEPPAHPGLTLYFYTPEDILLQKLLWFRMGGETSDRQWRDIRGIVLTQGQALDAAYLEKQAQSAGIADLLHRALHT